MDQSMEDEVRIGSGASSSAHTDARGIYPELWQEGLKAGEPSDDAGLDALCRRAEERAWVLSSAVEAGPANVVITDAKGQIVYVNPSFVELTGFKQEEVLGKNPRFWKSDHHPRAFYRRLWATLLAGKVWRGNLCNRKKGGEVYWVHAAISPVKNLEGKLSHFVAVTVDVTQDRWQEEALRQAQEQLERKVQKRTAELSAAIQALEQEVEARRRAEDELREQLSFEKLLSGLCRRIDAASAQELESELASGLELVGQALRADDATLVEVNEGGARVWRWWHRSGQPAATDQITADMFPWVVREIRAEKVVHVTSLDQFPGEAAQDWRSCARAGVKSLLAMPLVTAQAVTGMLVVRTRGAERRWPEETVQRAQLVANMYASALLRRRSEKALIEARSDFHTVAAFIREWEYWITPDRRLAYCSPACERITGHGVAEFLADPGLLAGLVHPDDQMLWREHRCAGGKALQTLQFRIQTKTGKLVWIEHTCQGAIGEGGDFLGIRACNRDITSAKLAELEGQQLREDLARASRVSTAGHLAASLAHELNQPLAAILASAQAAVRFLEQSPPDLGEVGGALQDIVRADQRAGEVIRRLRGFFGKAPSQMTRLNLNELIQETVGLMRGEFIMKQTSVTLSLRPDLPEVAGNWVTLQQVLLNLLINALEAFVQANSPVRRLHLTTGLGPEGTAQIEVQDSGPGVEPAHLDSIFQPFISTKAKGMGLGLPLSRSIIEAHLGVLWAENNPAGGASFFFRIPVANCSNP